MGELEKRILELNNLLHKHDFLLKQAKKEFPSVGSLRELREYIVKLYGYWNPLGDDKLIFSQRHFLNELDTVINVLIKWFGD